MSHTLLAIDDSPDVHRLLDVRLRPDGLAIHHAHDAQQGLAMARELKPDLILLDVDLPEVTGFELCRRLKEDSGLSHVPIIFLTGASQVHDIVEGFDLGAVDYVLKPFEPAELRARVRAALRTKRYHDLLAARSQIDGLTGLWNRAHFNQRLGEEVSASQRYGRLVSLVLLDVDHFKGLNDQYGHPFGDQVLETLGQILHEQLRATDAPCRYGGEEFGVILSETDEEGARITAERLRQRIAQQPFRPKDRHIEVTASFGVATSTMFEKGAVTTVRLLGAADDALYKAKHEGRNRVCIGMPNPAVRT